MLGFDDYPDIAARLRSIVAGERPARTRRRTGASCCRSRPVERDAASVSGARPRDRGPGRRSGRTPARRRSDRAAEAGQRLRPALLVLRHPDASAAPSSAAGPPTCSPRPAGWPSRASASCSWSARTPPPTARTSATCGCWRPCCPSWPRSTASSGCGSPTSSRPRPGPGLIEAIADTAGVAPYFDLSFQHASGPVLRRMRRFGDPDELPGPAGAGARPRPRGRGALQRDRRASPARPRTTWRRCATSWSRPGWTSPASSATPTRTAPRPRRSTASSTRTRSGPGSSTSPRWSRSSRPAGRGADRRDGAGARRVGHGSTAAGGRGPRPPTRAPRSTAPPRWTERLPTPGSGDLVDGRGHRHRRVSTWWLAAEARAMSAPAGAAGEGLQPEPAQRADHAADRDGAVLRLGAARRRRRLAAVAHAWPS